MQSNITADNILDAKGGQRADDDVCWRVVVKKTILRAGTVPAPRIFGAAIISNTNIQSG